MNVNVKHLFLIFLSVLTLLAFAACGEKFETAEDYANRSYIYEGGGFGGDFSITLDEDGTFSYYEGLLSSYIGFGSWTVEGDIITLTEDPEGTYGFVNHFRMEDGDLVFVSEGSSDFLYVDVSDGERFVGKSSETPKNIEE